MKIKLTTFLLVWVLFSTFAAQAQRGVRIGYIDMEYILENIPEYQEAVIQLESRVQRWKQDIDKQDGIIKQMKTDLSIERALLTAEMIEEREEEIQIKEDELFQYQQDRFGPNGDLAVQRRQLVQPVQDQVFNIVQDIAVNRNYDFIFDKSADVVMLFAAERNDLSDQVIRVVNRAAKREQATSRKEEREITRRDEMSDEQDGALNEREQRLQERQRQRDSIMEERRRVRDSIVAARRDAMEARRGGGSNNASTPPSQQSQESTTEPENNEGGDTVEEKSGDNQTEETPKSTPLPNREEVMEQRQQERDSIRKARAAEAEARRQQILEERQQRRDSILNVRNGGSNSD